MDRWSTLLYQIDPYPLLILPVASQRFAFCKHLIFCGKCLILHSDKWIGRSPFFTTKTWGPLCICESGAGVHSARGSILPGGPFCPGVHSARGSILPGGPFCPGGHSARGSILPGGPFCPGGHSARGSILPGGPFCISPVLWSWLSNFHTRSQWDDFLCFSKNVPFMACVQGRSQGGHGGHVPTPLGRPNKN